MSGPARTPTNILKLRGSWRGDLNPNEPKVDICIPAMPKCLRGEAKKEWERVTPMLLKTGCIANTDMSQLQAYCVVHAKSVDVIRHPKSYSIGEMDKIFRLVNKLAAEFGLSPSSRTRIKVENKAEDKDEFAELEKPKIG